MKHFRYEHLVSYIETSTTQARYIRHRATLAPMSLRRCGIWERVLRKCPKLSDQIKKPFINGSSGFIVCAGGIIYFNFLIREAENVGIFNRGNTCTDFARTIDSIFRTQSIKKFSRLTYERDCRHACSVRRK